MIEVEVQAKFAAAKAGGRSYLLVCYDTLDRLRGDDDLGYYYPAFDDEQAVREYIMGHQLGVYDSKSMNDVCEAIIDVKSSDTFSQRICRNPRNWLDASTTRS